MKTRLFFTNHSEKLCTVNVWYLFITIIALLPMITLGKQAKKKTAPDHPSALTYDSLGWQVPLGTPYRHELKNGAIAYIAKDSSLPLIKITVYLKHGSLSDPKGKEGLSALYAKMVRSGGTNKFPADTLEELIDLLALNIGFSCGESQSTFSASFLSEYTENAFTIMREMFYNPLFDQKKFNKERAIMVESIKHQFDNPGPTLSMAYEKQLYANQASSRMITEKSLMKLTQKDLFNLHKSVFSPANMIFCIAGAFDEKSMPGTIESLLSGAPADKASKTFPAVELNCKQKALIVHRPISQAYVRLGLPLFKRPHPDYYAVSLLNEILGGGGFTSRLGEKVRSDAGLTYSIYSTAQSNYTYPGTFYINFFTKNESFAHAVALTLSEVTKIIDSGVTEEELQNAKATLIGQLPSMFRSPDDIVSTYGWNEYYNRAPDHFKVYEKKLNAISSIDLLRVAKTYLKPDSMTFTVVGDTTALLHQKYDTFSLDNLKPEVIDAESINALP